jgi:hypothetical protein
MRLERDRCGGHIPQLRGAVLLGYTGEQRTCSSGVIDTAREPGGVRLHHRTTESTNAVRGVPPALTEAS